MNRAYLLGVLWLGACTSVLGIEDLHEGPRPGAGGEDSTAGTTSAAGKTNSGGKTGNGGSPAISPALVDLVREAWTIASIELGAA